MKVTLTVIATLKRNAYIQAASSITEASTD